MFRKWLRRSYVPISELNDVDAEERRRKNRLWCIPISELTDEDAAERRQKQGLRNMQNYVRISELNVVDAAERRRKQKLRNKKHHDQHPAIENEKNFSLRLTAIAKSRREQI
jgi:hypothetical protein